MKINGSECAVDIVIASNNQDKIREIRQIFILPNVNLLTLDQFTNAPAVEEDGNTLFENAFKKASMLSKFTGLPTLADDTGLEVNALNGLPGVHSSRYAGVHATYDENTDKLLNEILKIPNPDRNARFLCVALFYHPEMTLSEEGYIEGIILTKRHGFNGFGYDPIFYVPKVGKTFAEMTIEEKNTMSHRGMAFRNLHNSLKSKIHQLTIKY